jgi:hypothetical protein
MSKYWPVNEMLTEYISRKAIKKLERNIVSICDNEAETKLGYPLFDPVVERLENTWIFKELLEAKITNDFTKVLKDIGKDGLHELSRCLVDFSAKPFRLEKLETLIENLNKRKDARSR